MGAALPEAPNNILDIAAVAALVARGLIAPASHSLLRPLADLPRTEAEFRAAIDRLRQDGYLDGDHERLSPELELALGILADPVRRVRVVHLRTGAVPRSLTSDSDGASAVTLLGVGEELAVGPVEPLSRLVDRTAELIAGGGEPRGGARIETTLAELGLLGALGRASTAMTSATAQKALRDIGADMELGDVTQLLVELGASGWLDRRGELYAQGAAYAEAWRAILAPDSFDVEVTELGDSGQGRQRVRRFARAGESVWAHLPLPTAEPQPRPLAVRLVLLPLTPALLEAELADLFGINEVEPRAAEAATGVMLRRARR